MPAKVIELARALLRRIRPAFSRRFAALWVIAVVNLVLIVLYVWSRDGSTVQVRVEAIGSEYQVFVDGRPTERGVFEGRDVGGIGFGLPGDVRLPSLPGPTGVDSVRVTDATSGDVIFEDSFSGSPSNLWEVESGDWNVRDGLFSTSTRGVVTTGFQSWGDYVLEARLRNVTEATIYVRLEDSGNSVAFAMRPYRNFDSSLRLFDSGAEVAREAGGLNLARAQTVRSIAAMLLRPYPTVALMVMGVIIVAFLLRLAWLDSRLQALGNFILNRGNFIVPGLAVGAFALLWYAIYVLGEAMPHVPDSVAYVFQAKIFASFSITADPPPVHESFSFFEPAFMLVVDGRWFTQYSFGHPLFLSIGQLFRAVWVVPPLLGAASIVLIYQVGKHVYGAMVGVLAALLLLFSPFFQMTASNFMSHNTAVFVILASLFLFARQGKPRTLSMFFSGVFLGLLFNMRPLVAVAFIPVLGLFMGYELLRAGSGRSKLFREDLAFAAGGLVLLLAYFLYNQATTGSFTLSGQASITDTSDALGFGGKHSVARGLQNQQALLSLMLLVANGWPVTIGLFLAALPFVLGTRNRWDYFLAASALALAGANTLYVNAAIMHGPRYFYETMPFLMLLTARGAQSLRDAGSTAGNWLASRIGWAPSVSTLGVTGFAVCGLVIGLVVFSAWGWTLGQRVGWGGTPFTPRTLSELNGFNNDRRLLDRADEMDLANALVLVDGCGDWWCYGSVFWTNSPDLDTDVVWANQHGTPADVELLGHYEGRNLYVADYGSGTIRSATKAEIISGVEGTVSGASPEVPTSEKLDAVERDQTRRQDLDKLRQALEVYAEQNGAYPDTGGKLQTLCVDIGADAGCALATVLTELPSDPLGSSSRNDYWYLSDGASFVLIARLEEMEVEEDECPDLVARLAGGEARYCLQGPSP